MKPNDFRSMSGDELLKKKNDLAQELFNLKFQLHTGRLENSAKLSAVRKDIARVNTIMREKRG